MLKPFFLSLLIIFFYVTILSFAQQNIKEHIYCTDTLTFKNEGQLVTLLFDIYIYICGGTVRVPNRMVNWANCKKK